MGKPVEIEFLMRDRLTGGMATAGRSVDVLGDKVDGTTRRIHDMGGAMEGTNITQFFKTAAAAAVGFFTIQQAKSFASDIIRVRGEMQLMATSFEVLLQSKGRANEMLAEIKELAIKSPLSLSDVGQGAQMLLGFGIQAEKVTEILQQMSDVSMGSSQRFNSLIYAFSQMSAVGYLVGNDMRQMSNAGFNPLQAIAAQTGETIGELNIRMSNSAITAEEVAAAFKHATSEGGRFFGMTEKGSQGLVGLQAQLKGAIEEMYNKIGESQEGVIAGGYKMATSLVNNYETVGRVLGVLIVGYGSYKAALISTALVQKAVTASGNIQAWFELAKGIKTAKDAQVGLNLAMGANPIVKIVSLLIAAGTAMYLFSRKTKEAEEEVLGLARAQRKATEEHDKEAAKIKALQDIMNNSKVAYDERKRALNELKQIIPSYNAQLSEEGNLINNNTTAIKNYLEQLEKQIRLKSVQEELEEAIRTERQQQREYDTAQAEYSRMNTNSAYHEKPIIDVLGAFGGRDIQKAEKAANEALDNLKETQRTIAQLKGEIESSGGSGSPVVQSFTEQLNNAKSAVSRLKGELADLLAGKGNESDFAKAIDDKKKELEAAQKRLNLLTGVDKASTKAGLDTNRQKVTIGERERQIAEYTQRVTEEVTKAELEITQARIDGMEAGIEKEVAQIEHNYNKLIAENLQRREEMVRELQKAEQLQWENDNPDYKDKGLVFKATSTNDNLTDDQKRILVEYVAAANAYRVKAETDLLKELAKEFENYEQKKLRITNEYQVKIDELRKNGYEKEALEAEKRREKELTALSASVIQASDLFVVLFANASHVSSKTIKKVIADTKILLDYISGYSGIKPKGFSDEELAGLINNPEQIKAIYDGLIKQNDELDSRSNYLFSNIVKGFKLWKQSAETARRAEEAINKEVKKGLEFTAEQEKERGFRYLIDGASQVAGYLTVASQKMKELADATGDAKLGEFADQFGALSQNLQAAGEGAASGGWIGAIIGGATDLIGQFVNGIIEAKAYAAELNRNLETFNEKLGILELSRMVGDNENAFGAKSLKNAYENATLAKEAMRQYEEEVTKRTLPNIAKEFKNVGVVIAGGGVPGIWGLGKRVTNEYKTALSAYEKGYSDLEAMAIKTTKKSAIAKLFGAKETYTSLKDFAPQLWKDGVFDTDAAKIFLETNKQITSVQKEQIQNAIALKEVSQNAMDVLNSEVERVFGYLGSAATNSLTEGIKNSTSAWELFKKAGSGAFGQLGEDLAYELYLATRFETLQKDLVDSYNEGSPESIAKKQANILESFFTNAKGDMEAAQAWMVQWQAMAKEKGFDLSGESDQVQQQSGKAGAFQTMDQETGTEIKGLFTSVQMHVSSIDDKLDQVVSLYDAGDQLERIADSTEATAKGVQALLDEVKRIIRDGLKVK